MNATPQQLDRERWTRYRRRFGSEPKVWARAPGRVNLIGEHTDYNDGFVLPVAIDRYVQVLAGARDDGRLVAFSENYGAEVEVALDRLAFSREHPWVNYVQGVAHELLAADVALRGAHLYVWGDVPVGAGLSSSAALEVAVALALLRVSEASLPERKVVQLCQRAENAFVGVQCGIMDPFVSCYGRSNQAIFLDCRTLDFEYVPVPPEVTLLVCDTRVRRELAASEYNVRRQQCQAACAALAAVLPGIRALRDVAVADFEAHQSRLDPLLRKRARHVVSENQRVREAVTALRRGDLAELGKLLQASHASLRDDYEVSCPELDAVVEICADRPEVYGARLTGAGFGGSALCLVEGSAAARTRARLVEAFRSRFGQAPGVYECAVGDGAQVGLLT